MTIEKHGFERYTTETLLLTYANLTRGVDRIAEILESDEANGTDRFHESPADTKGGIPPAQFGVLGLWLLQSITTELSSRKVPLPTSKES